MTLSVALITKNEEKNIVDCLESVKWANEIVVVDSGSTDQTVELAKRYTAEVIYHPFKNFSDQKNQVLAHTKGNWVFFIDADERVSPALAQEIKKITLEEKEEAVYEVRRDTYFFSKRLRFSGTGGDAPIRLFPRKKVRFEQPVHEHIVTDLPVRRLQGKLHHYSTRDLEHYKVKLKQYVDLEFETMSLKDRKVTFWDVGFRPAGKFLVLYILQLGILDGWAGLQYAALSSYYVYLKYSKFLSKTKVSHVSRPS